MEENTICLLCLRKEYTIQVTKILMSPGLSSVGSMYYITETLHLHMKVKQQQKITTSMIGLQPPAECPLACQCMRIIYSDMKLTHIANTLA